MSTPTMNLDMDTCVESELQNDVLIVDEHAASCYDNDAQQNVDALEYISQAAETKIKVTVYEWKNGHLYLLSRENQVFDAYTRHEIGVFNPNTGEIEFVELGNPYARHPHMDMEAYWERLEISYPADMDIDAYNHRVNMENDMDPYWKLADVENNSL